MHFLQIIAYKSLQNLQNKNLAIANKSRVSCINTNRSHNLATSGESRRYVVAFTRFAGGGICLFQESLRHILASPWYAHGTIAVNVTWMERGFNAGQTHRSMYQSIFKRSPVIQPESSKVRHFSTFFAHFLPPRVRPSDNRGKCYMDRKRIQCWSNASLHIPIYLQPFLRYSDISVASDFQQSL